MELRFVVPMCPPSSNHYKNFRVIPTKDGKFVPSWYHTDEAKAWFGMVAAVAAGRKIRGPSYELSLIVFTATKRTADLDNFFKCVADGLQHAGVIDDDKRITDIHGHRRYDPTNPRTVIVIKSEQESLFEKE